MLCINSMSPLTACERDQQGHRFYLFDRDASVLVEAAQKQRASLKPPGIATDDYLDMLLKQGLTQAVKALNGYRSVI